MMGNKQQKSNKKSKNKILILIIIVALLFGGRIAINYFKTDKSTIESAIPVSVTTVEEKEYSSFIEIFGSAKAEKESIIVPKVPAKVETINVVPGQVVKKGDILFVMDTKDIDSQLKQSEAAYDIAKSNQKNASGAAKEQQLMQLESALESAEINYNDAKVNYERVNSLFESGGISKKDLEQVESGFKIAKTQYETAKRNYELYVNDLQKTNESIAASQLKQAEAGYDTAKNQFDDMTVKSDIDGEVGISRVELGKVAGSGQNVAMTVVDYRTIVLDLTITEENVTKINKDSRCTVTFDALPEKEFEGTIEGISSSVDPQTRLYQVKVLVDNTEKTIKPGMYASVKIYQESIDNAISVPLNVLINENEQNYVFLAGNDNVVKKQTVEISGNNGYEALIISGLKKGDQLVNKGQDYLADGDKVKIIAE